MTLYLWPNLLNRRGLVGTLGTVVHHYRSVTISAQASGLILSHEEEYSFNPNG